MPEVQLVPAIVHIRSATAAADTAAILAEPVFGLVMCQPAAGAILLIRSCRLVREAAFDFECSPHLAAHVQAKQP